jgi:hypothetical protein
MLQCGCSTGRLVVIATIAVYGNTMRRTTDSADAARESFCMAEIESRKIRHSMRRFRRLRPTPELRAIRSKIMLLQKSTILIYLGSLSYRKFPTATSQSFSFTNLAFP